MNQPPKMVGNGTAARYPRAANVPVPENWLLPVRGTIAAMALLAVVVFADGLLLDYAQFRVICTGTLCADSQLTPESAQTLQALHLSLDAYALISVVLLVVQASLAEQRRNLCANPGFELLNPAGDNFPLNWGVVRYPQDQASVVIDKHAHGGSIAVRMSETATGTVKAPIGTRLANLKRKKTLAGEGGSRADRCACCN